MEALRGLPHTTRTLYREGLRPYMNFSTGLVGVERKVSYQQFKELLEVDQDRGSKTDAYEPTLEQMRNMFRQLIRHGLVVKIKQEKRTAPMVYKLVFADTKQIRPNEEPHMNPIGGTPKQNAVFPEGNGNIRAVNPIGTPYDEPHTSVYTDNPKYIGSFTMPDDWEPDAEIMKGITQRGGVDIALLDKTVLTKFITHHKAAKSCLDQDQWHSKLFNWLSNEKANRAGKATTGSKQGFIEKHQDPSWREGLA
jgi:hypothetical protein